MLLRLMMGAGDDGFGMVAVVLQEKDNTVKLESANGRSRLPRAHVTRDWCFFNGSSPKFPRATKVKMTIVHRRDAIHHSL